MNRPDYRLDNVDFETWKSEEVPGKPSGLWVYMCQGHMAPPPLPRGMVYPPPPLWVWVWDPPAPPVDVGFGI